MSESNNPKKTFPKLLHIAAAVSAVVLLAVGGITAYLTDLDVRRNVITIGSVKAVLDEGDYTDSQILVPGQIVDKAPKMTNTGKNDAYVFLKIEVPKAEVTLLHEDTGKVKIAKSVQQIFKLLANSENVIQILPAEEEDPTKRKDISITYHGKTDAAEGWILLDSYTVTGEEKDTYVFGYSRKLSSKSPDNVTLPLFDKVQLKSIIDHELHDVDDLLTNMQITVQGYAIQDRNLQIEGMEDSAENPTDEQLTAIYQIVQRKAAQNNG